MRLSFCEERCIGIPLYYTKMIDPVLFKAYQSTKFIVCAPPRDVVLAIGEHNSALEDLMEQYDSQSGAFITAWNPGSLRITDAENQARQTELITEVRERGYVFFGGPGSGSRSGVAARGEHFHNRNTYRRSTGIGQALRAVRNRLCETRAGCETPVVPRIEGLRRSIENALERRHANLTTGLMRFMDSH